MILIKIEEFLTENFLFPVRGSQKYFRFLDPRMGAERDKNKNTHQKAAATKVYVVVVAGARRIAPLGWWGGVRWWGVFSNINLFARTSYSSTIGTQVRWYSQRSVYWYDVYGYTLRRSIASSKQQQQLLQQDFLLIIPPAASAGGGWCGTYM